MPTLEHILSSADSHVMSLILGMLMTSALYNTGIILVLLHLWREKDGH